MTLPEKTDNSHLNLLQSEKQVTILAVEDDELSMAFLEAQVTELGHAMHKACNGKEALEWLALHSHTIDVILMDREMPVMNGITAVKHIKEDPVLRQIPVIMITAADSAEDMREGLEAGVFYYITKPVDGQMLSSVIAAAVRDIEQSRVLAGELSLHKGSFQLIRTCKFEFSTLAHVEGLAAFAANCFPNPKRVLTGLGQLMINAVEHGNLGVGYEGKSELVASGIWRAEIERCQQLPEHAGKRATASIVHKENGVYAVIEDMGQGFNWKKYLQIDPSRAGDSHGRGIAQANALSFDKLTYNEQGNKAVAWVSHTEQLEW